MEKQTKILVGAGALVALYLLYNKYQKDVLNKKVVMLPVKPVVALPVEPVVMLPVEPAPLEPLPIFTNPIDDFINPVVSVEPAPVFTIEPVVTLPVEPVFATPIEINTADQFVFQKPLVYSLNATFGNNFGDVCDNPYQNILLYTLDSIVKIGSIIYKDELLTIPFNQYFSIGDGNVYGCYDNGEIAVIFEGKCNEIINKVQSVEPASVEPVFTLPVEPASVEPVFTLPVEPAPVEPVFTLPVEPAPVESIMIGTVIGNDLNEICSSEERTLLFTSLYDWNRASTWSGLTFYEDSQLTISVTNAKYIKKWMDNNRNIYEISNGLVGKSLGDCIDLIQTTNKLTKLDPKIWGGTIGVNFILGNTLEDICSKQKSQNVSDITKLYLEQELWTAYYQNLTGVTLFIDESLKTPYGNGFITTFGLDGLTIYEINNGIVGKSLGTCSVLINKPIIESINPVDSFVYSAPSPAPAPAPVPAYTVQGGAGFSAANSIDEICNKRQFDIGDPVVIYFKAFNGIGSYGQIGAKLYKDREVKIPYTDSIYVTKWRANPKQEIMKLDGNGTIIQILNPC